MKIVKKFKIYQIINFNSVTGNIESSFQEYTIKKFPNGFRDIESLEKYLVDNKETLPQNVELVTLSVYKIIK